MVTGTLVEDRRSGVWVVALHGVLDVQEAALVATVVKKCVDHCPAAIVVDLHGLTEASGSRRRSR